LGTIDKFGAVFADMAIRSVPNHNVASLDAARAYLKSEDSIAGARAQRLKRRSWASSNDEGPHWRP
jgi:hypothetical protein